MKLSNNDVVCLAILEKLEAFRCTLSFADDWTVRMCEAIVAGYTQFDDRSAWVQAIDKTTLQEEDIK